MRYKVILTTDFAVEIICELEPFDTKQILNVLKEFKSYSSAVNFVLSKECVYSSFLVVDIANIIMVIPKRDIGKIDNFTLIKAFVEKNKAEKFKVDCYDIP